MNLPIGLTWRLITGFIAVLLIGLNGCGGSGGDSDDSDSGTASVTFPAQAQNINFVAGVPQEFTTVNTFDVAALGGPFEAVTVDTTQALGNLTVAVMRPAPLAIAQKTEDWVDNGSYMTDMSTGIDWLKLSETSQYPEVTAQMFIDGDGMDGPFDNFKSEGWVMADVRDVRQLLGQLFGSPFPDSGQSGVPTEDIDTAFDFFGFTSDVNGNKFGEALAFSDLGSSYNPLCSPYYQNDNGDTQVGSACFSSTIGLNDTQANAGFSFGIWANRGGPGPLTTGATVQHYIGTAEEEDDLCNTGLSYPALTVFLDSSNQVASVQPTTFTASQDIVDIFNTGSVATCSRVTTNVGAVASMSGLEADYESCTQEPGDFHGSWSGTYSCIGSCPDGGDITLTVNQDGSTATYSDSVGAANYSGHICGDVFSFRGGNTLYDESGKLTLTGPNSAMKTSSFRQSATCSGTCTDYLTRQ